jgi:tetratricopeptide (TPR) repeat protein
LDKARVSMVAFHRALVQDKQALRVAGWLQRVRQAVLVSGSDKTTWRASRLAHARLFEYYRRVGRNVWTGPPDQAPPLALYLFRRAIHFGRKAVFSRGPVVRGKTAARARQLLLTYYPVLVRGNWLLHPVWHRFDLLQLTGYLRRNPRMFRTTGFPGPEGEVSTVRRLVRLQRYKESENFVLKHGKANPKKEVALRLSQGTACVGMEQWKRAREILLKAARLGSVAAVAELVQALVKEGDLAQAALKLSQSGAYAQSAEISLARAALAGRLGQWKAAAVHAERAAGLGGGARAQRAWGLALAALGKLPQAVKRFQAAFGNNRWGCAARADVAGLYLAVGKYELARKTALVLAGTAGCRAARAHALLAAVSHRQGRKKLARLLVARAEFHASTDPELLVSVARILVQNRAAPQAAGKILRRAIRYRPRWSVPHALLARLLAEGGSPGTALIHIRIALKRRPHDPDYRGLFRAILKLRSGS